MNTSPSSDSAVHSLESTLDLYLGHQAPALPQRFRELCVQFAPWINILSIYFMLPLIVGMIGFGSIFRGLPFMSEYSMMPYGDGDYGAMPFMMSSFISLGFLFPAAAIVLQLLAIPGLFKRASTGWRFAYYAVLVQVVSAIVMFSVHSLIGLALALYFLFQIRSYFGLPAFSHPELKSPPPTR